MLRYLLEKEFKQFFRNSFLPRLIVIFPLTALLIYPLVANFDIKNINLSVVDQDKSPFSRSLVQKIQASGYFRISNISSNFQQALISIESDESDIILEIPPHFERMLIREKKAGLMISANAVNGVKGGLGTAYLSGIISDFNTDIRMRITDNYGRLKTQSLAVLPLYRYNPQLLYEVFMVPALMVMVLAMVCGFLPALNIVTEKEQGTIEQMNVTPVSKFTLILSKLLPYWVFGYVVLTVCIGVALFVWDLLPLGSLAVIYLFATLFVLGFSGFGLVVSNYAATTQQAMFMIFFFVLTFIFLSGLYTPVANMPHWAQFISSISPLKYIIEVLRMVYLKGSSIKDLLPQFLALVGFAVFFNGWAVLSYRKSGY